MSLAIDVRHRRGDFTLAARFVSEGKLTVLFGRSGSGKTTLINLIAGLLKPDAGRVSIDGQPLVDTANGVFIPAHRRRVGYVFQEGRLFPHMTVRRNLLFGRWFTPHGEHHGSLDDIVDLLGIGHLLDRHPASLSGGEKQRVAIGRALLASPRILLMDEPLAALDDARKAEILPYIERLRDEAGVPIVYVSHSVAEVVRLATTVVALSDGQVVATGTAAQVMTLPGVAAITSRAEVGAVLDMRVAAHDVTYGLTTLSSPAGEIRVPYADLRLGTMVRVQVLARDVMIGLERPTGLSALNILSGTVVEIGPSDGSPDNRPGGPIVDLRIDCHGQPVLAQLTRYSIDKLGLSIGRSVYAIVKSVSFASRS
jgi:molybdate transport system ATP-binding protein